MVWKAIGLCTIGELDRLKELLRNKQTTNDNLSITILQLKDEKHRADRIEAKYDALVEKIASKAAKPDDGIIHAKNSGDVRRLFEQQVAALERDKQQEN